MACVHNQAKINELNVQIEEKNEQISCLVRNISECSNIQVQHQKFNNKVNCVINNLSETTVIAGVSYDYGMMTECLNDSNKIIDDCLEIIKESFYKIDMLKNDILSLETAVEVLQGICNLCLIEQDDNRKD